MAQAVFMFGKTFDRNTSDFWLGMFCGHLSLTRHGNHRGISFVFSCLVGLAEIGDKTQLLAFILAARFKRPLAINFGIPAAICTGDYLIAESFKKITEIEQGWHQNILLGLLSGTVKEIVFGQSGDLSTNFLNLGWEDYKNVAMAKTSPLICLPMMGMFKCAELGEPYYINLRKITDEIGLAYQIVNDLENILLNQANEIPTDIKFERMNALVVLIKEKSTEKEINFLKKNKEELKQFLISSNIKDDLIDRIQLILVNIKDSLHLMPIVIRPIISSLCEGIDKKASQFIYAK